MVRLGANVVNDDEWNQMAEGSGKQGGRLRETFSRNAREGLAS